VVFAVCTELMVKMCPDNDCLTNYLHLLDRCTCHQVTHLSLPFPFSPPHCLVFFSFSDTIVLF